MSYYNNWISAVEWISKSAREKNRQTLPAKIEKMPVKFDPKIR